MIKDPKPGMLVYFPDRCRPTGDIVIFMILRTIRSDWVDDVVYEAAVWYPNDRQRYVCLYPIHFSMMEEL